MLGLLTFYEFIIFWMPYLLCAALMHNTDIRIICSEIYSHCVLHFAATKVNTILTLRNPSGEMHKSEIHHGQIKRYRLKALHDTSPIPDLDFRPLDRAFRWAISGGFYIDNAERLTTIFILSLV